MSMDLSSLKAHMRSELLQTLDGVVSASRDSSMALVLDPSLSGPLGLVSEVKGLREHGVEKIYHLLPEPLQTECTSITYIIRPEVRLVEQLASQVRGLEKARPRGEAPRSYALFFLPRRSMLCEKVLTDEGVYGLLNVHELPIPLFVLEEDVISLEQPAACFRQCFHDANRSVLHACATGLVQLQAIYGRIPTVRGKGTCSQTVIALMQQMLDAVAGEDKEVGASTAAQTKRMDPPPVSEIVAAAATAAQQALRAAVASGDGDDGTEGGRVGGAVVTPESGSAGGQAVVGGRGDAECGRISELLLIDRDVDLVSPLCTELTYEGLIHAVFGIAHGYVDLDLDVDGGGKGGEGKSGSASSSGTKKLAKRELSNNDPLYAQIRNLNFGELGPLLNRLARGVSDGYEERHQAQTVSQIKDYMKRLNKLQQEHKSLSTHVALAEQIQKVTKEEGFHRRLECEQEALSNAACSPDAEALIEDLAAAGEALPSVLRLLCLLSVVSNGIKPRALAHLQSELTHAYGYDRLALTWPALARVGLLKPQAGRSSFPALRKALKLVVDSMPDHELGAEPADMAYVYAGYAPLSVRLLHAMTLMPPNLEDTLRLLPGPFVSITQQKAGVRAADNNSSVSASSRGGPVALGAPPTTAAAAAGVPSTSARAGGSSDDAASSAPPPVTLVFFVGGCTFAEVAALRWLSRNATPRREYVVATTHICSGDTMLESLVMACDNGLEKLT